jgi:hypothetical protein
MFMMAAERSKRFGFQQPRSYLEVNNKNFSEIQSLNSNYSFGADILKTNFFKVKITITRLKNKDYKEVIDCSDMTF